jgi:hypothetical protein
MRGFAKETIGMQKLAKLENRSQCRFLFESRRMKLESQVIVENNATVNMFLGFAHTARRTRRVVMVWRREGVEVLCKHFAQDSVEYHSLYLSEVVTR